MHPLGTHYSVDTWTGTRFNSATIENFKSIWTHLTYSGNMSQIYEFYWFISKQTWEPFVFIKHCDWTIFFHVSRFDCLHCNITIKKTKLAELSWYHFYEYSDSKSLLATTKKWYNFENIMNWLLESMWLLLTWFYYKEQK